MGVATTGSFSKVHSFLKWALFACALVAAVGIAYSVAPSEAEAQVSNAGGSSAGGGPPGSASPPPLARNDHFIVAEDKALRIPARGVLRNDRGAGLRAFKVTNPRNGRLTLRQNGSLVYIPKANFNGRDFFVYRARDNRGRVNRGVVTIIVRPVNDAPVARGDSYKVDEDGTLTVNAPGVLANDTDVDRDRLSATKVSGPDHGKLTLRPNGSLTYEPDADFNGSDSFTYRASDGKGGSGTATVDINVNPVNDAPTFDLPQNENQAVDEDSGSHEVSGFVENISPGPSDEAGQNVALTLSDDNGELFTQNGRPDVDQSGKLTYTLAPEAFGEATVTVKAEDDGPDSPPNENMTEKTFTITALPVNDAPSFTKGTDETVDEDAGPQTVSGWATNISKGPANESGQTVGFTVSNDDNDLFTQSGQPAVGSDGTLTYTSAENASGEATVTVKIEDDGGTERGGVDESAEETFTITIEAVNDAPKVAAPASIEVTEDVASELTGISVSDVDAGSGNITLALSVDSGTLAATNGGGVSVSGSGTDEIALTGTLADINTYIEDGNVSFTTALDATAEVELTATADDGGNSGKGGAKTDEANIALTVIPVNDPPTVAFDNPPTSADEGDAKTFDFTVTDPDAGDSFTVKNGFPDCGTGGTQVGQTTTTAAGGSFECRFPDGAASPNVRIQVADADDIESNVAEQSVNVANVAPNVTAADDQTSNEGENKPFGLGAFTDPGTDGPWEVTVEWGDGSTNTTFEVAEGERLTNGTFDLGERSHTYADDRAAPYEVTVTVAETGGTPSDSDTFEVEVANVAPTATLENDGPKDEGEPVTVSFTDQSDLSDADTNAGFRYAYNCDGSEFDPVPTHDSLAGSADSTECTFNDGEHTVSALIMDKDGGFTEYETTFTVNNSPPTATPQSVTAQAETPTTITLEGADPSDGLPNPDVLSFEITSLPDDGKLFVGDDTSGTEISEFPFILAGDKVTYLPDDAFAGGDGFDFKANDGKAKSAAARVAITVVAADPATTTITADPTRIVADGTSTSEITVQLKDANDNNVTTGSGYTVDLETTAGTLSNVTNNGDGTFTATLTSDTTAGEATISGKLSGGGMSEEPITDDATVAFVHGPLDGFTVEQAGGGDIGTQLAGTAFDVKVTAVDANGNTVKSFEGNVAFTSEPSGGVSAGGNSANFTEGVLSSHSITFGTPGEFTLTATGGGKSGTSNQFAVEAPPSATGDGPGANSQPGEAFHTPFNTTFNLSGPGIMSNDDRGFPQADVVSFGGGDLGGNVGSRNAGSTVSPIPVIPNDDRFAGVSENNDGSLTVNADGSVSFTPPEGFTGVYEFRYRIENSRDSSDALVRIAVGERPQAVGDTYSPTLVGNVPIDTQTITNFSVEDNDAGSATSLTLGTASNGTANLRNNGTFTFAPSAGHEGPASFTYTVKNGFGASSPATVSMSVANVVWFVNAGDSSNGDGTFGSPFNCLTGTGCFSAGASDEANDRIFLRGGSYAGGLTLKDGQRLIGQGASGTFGSAQNANVAWPADSGAEPSVGQAAPAITTTAASTNGINLNGAGASGANTLRGFTVGNTMGSGINGSGFGTLSVSGVGIGGSGQALNLSGGTLSGSLSGVTSTSGTNNIHLLNVGTSGTFDLGSGALSGATGASFRVQSGSGSFTYSGDITQSNDASLVNILNNNGTFTFSAGTLTATRGNGLQFNNADGTYNFNGTTTLSNTFVGTSADAGIDVIGGSSGAIRIADGTGSASITNPSGNAVNISGSNPTFTYGDSITKTNNTTTGILVQNNTEGAINFSGTTKTLTSTGTNPAVNLSNNNVNNGNTAINFTNGGLAVGGQSNAPGFSATGGGTVKVSGTGNTISTASGTALNVANTTIGAGASGEGGLNFRSISANGATNGIVLDNTGTGASNGGLTVAGTGSAGSGGTIQNTNVSGASFTNTRNINLSWMNFTNANSVDGGGANVCDLSTNAGCNGAIKLNNANGVALDRLSINGSAEQGINGINVTNFDLSNSTIQGAGNAINESGIYIFGLSGTQAAGTDNSITNTTVTGSGSANHNVFIRTSAPTNAAPGSPDRLLVSGSSFINPGSQPAPSDGITVSLRDTANFQTVVQNSTFRQDTLTNGTDGIQVDAGDNSRSDVSITGSSFTGGWNQAPVNISGSGNHDTTFNVSNNPTIVGGVGNGINVISNGGGIMRGTIANNPNITTGQANNNGIGVSVEASGFTTGLSDGRAVVDINNNTSTNYAIGLRGTTRGEGRSAAADLTIRNNTITAGGNFPLYGVYLTAGNGDNQNTTRTCVNLSDNQVSKGTNPTAIVDYALEQWNQGTFQIQGLTGSGTNAGNVQSFVSSRDIGGAGVDAVVGSTVNFTNATCATPPAP